MCTSPSQVEPLYTIPDLVADQGSSNISHLCVHSKAAKSAFTAVGNLSSDSSILC
jgi:hypothetical protein